jgi:hypothetical protein
VPTTGSKHCNAPAATLDTTACSQPCSWSLWGFSHGNPIQGLAELKHTYTEYWGFCHGWQEGGHSHQRQQVRMPCDETAVRKCSMQEVTSERGVCGGPLAFHYANLMSHTAFRQSLACVSLLHQEVTVAYKCCMPFD